MICNGFDKSIPEEVHRQAARTDCFRLGHPLLNLGVGKSRARTNGAIIDERAARDDFASVRDGDVRISETAIGSSMPHAQLRDLGRPARSRVLMALAAGLRVVEGAEAVVHCFGFIELLSVGLVGGVVNHAVTLVVEACGSFRTGWRIGSEGQGDTDNYRNDEAPHGLSLPF